jgi:hypothetical protein
MVSIFNDPRMHHCGWQKGTNNYNPTTIEGTCGFRRKKRPWHAVSYGVDTDGMLIKKFNRFAATIEA